MMGFTFGFGAPLGYAAAAGRHRRRPGRRSTPRRSCGIWGSTRSTPTRTARTMRWSACARPRGCSASARAPFLAACYAAAIVLLALAGVAGRPAGGWFFPALALPAALLARQVVPLDIHDPAGCLRSVPGEPRGRAGGRPPRSSPAGGCERSRPRSCAPIRGRARAAWCPRSRCIWRARSRRSGRRPRIGCARTNWIRRSGRSPGRAGRRWRGIVLDHPALVAGRRVLDFAAGCGIAAIACALAGAASVRGGRDRPAGACRDRG